MNTAILAGEIMLKSGAEAYRVEDTIRHILNMAHVENVDTIVLMTGIVATLDNPDMETITVIRRVESRGNNLNRIAIANDISRRFVREKFHWKKLTRNCSRLKQNSIEELYIILRQSVSAEDCPLFNGGWLEVAGAS